MLNKNQIEEIRKHLEKAQNPVFFFDNDSDGLCSFLLLQKYSNKGKGIPIRSFPELSVEYFRKIFELNADYIFILDKPLIAAEFFEEAKKYNIPIVCIDHHDIDKSKIPEFVNYFNPVFDGVNDGPTTYLCYQISQKKEDMWIAIVGCVADRFLPDFYQEFREIYPDLTIDSEDAFEVRYKSQIGKITNMLSFALKDRTTNVVNMMKFMSNAKNPYEVLEESQNNYTMHKRFNQINLKYKNLLEKAEKFYNLNKKILFFKYAGDLSISSDVANELCYMFPDKIVVVAYISGMKVNISARGKKVRDAVSNAVEGLENSTSGGHEEAVGAKVMTEDLEKFREKIEDFYS
ncbi:DHH family phosphoesterase [Candidatus Pacearchaeota archaeon]|nr:DHH family phosphoesterase [Candidatus Pacearchaeota archaeon]